MEWQLIMICHLAKISQRNKSFTKKVTETFIKTETFLFNLLKHGQEQGEISKHYDIKGLSQFIHNSLVGIRVLAKHILLNIVI